MERGPLSHIAVKPGVDPAALVQAVNQEWPQMKAFLNKDIPQQVRERVAAATHEELEVWAERLLTCDRAEEIFAEI